MIKIERRLIIFLFALLFLDLLILSFINRKSMCIQSQWLEEVVWHFSSENAINIYTCEAKIKTLYQEEIVDQVQSFNEHLVSIEKKLISLGPFVKGFRVHVITYANNSLQINGNELTVSSNLITESTGEALKRGLIKSWILQHQKTSGLDLFKIESLFNLFANVSELKIQSNEEWLNYIQGNFFRAAANLAWCNSPLKQIEYDSLCFELQKQPEGSGLSQFPIALWFGKKLTDIYSKLSLQQRLVFLKNYPRLIEILSEVPSENKGLVALSDIVVFLRKEFLIWAEAFQKIGMAEVAESLHNAYQLEEEAVNSYWQSIDFVFFQKGDWSAEQIKRFQELALTETSHKVFGFNEKGFWLWPFVSAVPESALDFSIKAKYIIYHSCELPSVQNLMMKWSDRVIWVQNCDEKPKPIVFNGFLHRGIQYLSLDNSHLKFVSFYLPALQFLVTKNPQVANSAFALKPMKDQQSNLAEVAAWKSALWKAEYRAYEVSATIGVVDWFKLPDGTWPEIMLKKSHSSKTE
jgi:hypothetical protein